MGRKVFRSNRQWSHLEELLKTWVASAVKTVEFGKLRKQGGWWIMLVEKGQEERQGSRVPWNPVPDTVVYARPSMCIRKIDPNRSKRIP